MYKTYRYKLIKESLDGTRGKRTKSYCSFEDDLTVGGLYVDLGPGFRGFYRVLSLEVEKVDN